MRVDGLTGYTVWPLTIPLQKIVDRFQAIYSAPDPSALFVTLATYATLKLTGVPLWMMLVGGPSTGKTEMLNLITGLPCTYSVSTMTQASLLSASKKKEWEKDATGGLLRQIGDRGYLILKDFTSILDMDNKARPTLLAALREIHDGKWDRPVGTDGARVLSWSGHVGIIAASTTAIDDYHEVMNKMGPRFLFYRMPRQNAEQQEAAARRSQENHRDPTYESRHSELIDAVKSFTAQIDNSVPEQDTQYAYCIDGIATLVARCRSQVTRARNSHDILNVHDPESPTRIVGQLTQLDTGLELVGLLSPKRYSVVRKTALFSIPPQRLRVLLELAQAPAAGLPMEAITRGTGRSNCVVDRAVEDLQEHGVVQRHGSRGSYTYAMRDEWLERWNRTPEGLHVPKNQGMIVEIRRAI